MLLSMDIPSLPAGQARALALVSHPDPSYEELAGIADIDPGVMAALLHAANSSASSPIKPVGTARVAMVRIGMRETRRIIMGVALAGSFPRVDQSGIDTTEMWRPLIATGLLADATAWGELRHTEAFTAGLLHDLGRLALAAGSPHDYGCVMHMVRAGAPVAQAEHAVFGVDHIQWGATIARHWRLPEGIVGAIEGHHEGRQPALGWVVTRARELAGSLGIGDGLLPPVPLVEGSEATMLPVLEELGGEQAIMERVAWYAGALAVA